MNAEIELAIESVDGAAQPAVLYLTPGEKLGPIDIGTQGNWRVHAAGVAPKHAALYYDGARLCVMSLDESSPLRVHGQAVPTSWVVIRPPCEIEVGSARLSFGPAEEEIDVTRVAGEEPTADGDADTGDESSDKTRVVSKEGLMDAVARHRASSGLTITGVPVSRGGSVPAPPSSRSGAPDLIPSPPPSSPFASSVGSSFGSSFGHTPSGRMPAVGSTVATRPGSSGFDIPQPSAAVRPQAPAPVPPPPTSGAGYSTSGFDHDIPTSQPTPPTAPTPPSVPTPGTIPLGDFDVPSPLSGPTPPTGTTHGSGVAVDMSRTLPAPPKSSLASMWKDMSFPQRATAILFLPMVAAVIVLFSDDPRLTGTPPQPMATPSPSAAAAAQDAAGTAETATAENEEQELAVEDAPESNVAEADSAGPQPATPELLAKAEKRAADADVTPAAKQRSQPRGKRGSKEQKTLQRKAVDAVAAAAYEEAATYYEELAKMDPDNPAYAAAASITRQKAARKPE